MEPKVYAKQYCEDTKAEKALFVEVGISIECACDILDYLQELDCSCGGAGEASPRTLLVSIIRLQSAIIAALKK